MIKIRYACLPEGLHATAVARGGHAFVYLRPGLRPGQRRAALARLRRNARLGHSPPLPAAGLAWALTADRIRRTLRDVLGTLHCHPLGAFGVAGVLAGVAVSYVTLMTVPLAGGSSLPAGSLSAGDGGPAAACQLGSAGIAASALVPLGMKPRPWTVPETRPPQRRAGQAWHTRHPGPHPSACRAPHRRSGWWRLRQPSGWYEWPSRPRRGGHGSPPRTGPGAHSWPPRHRRGRAWARERHGPAGRAQPAGRQESGRWAGTRLPGQRPQPWALGWPAADGGSPA